jgi:hypothetical protein
MTAALIRTFNMEIPKESLFNLRRLRPSNWAFSESPAAFEPQPAPPGVSRSRPREKPRARKAPPTARTRSKERDRIQREPSKRANTKRSTRFAVPTFAYRRLITDLTLTCSASSHPIDFSAGETTVVVKTTPPSHPPAKMTCSVCAIAPSMSNLPDANLPSAAIFDALPATVFEILGFRLSCSSRASRGSLRLMLLLHT